MSILASSWVTSVSSASSSFHLRFLLSCLLAVPTTAEPDVSPDLEVITGDTDDHENDDADAEGSIDDDNEDGAPLHTEEAVPSSAPVNIEVEDVDMSEGQHGLFHPPPDHDADVDMVVDGMSYVFIECHLLHIFTVFCS